MNEFKLTFEQFFERFFRDGQRKSTPKTPNYLTIIQMKILWLVYQKEETTSRELGEILFAELFRMRTTKSNLANVRLRVLFKKGLIAKEKNGRNCVWSLSAKSWEILRGVKSEVVGR